MEHHDHTSKNYPLGEPDKNSSDRFGTNVPMTIQEYRSKRAYDNRAQNIEEERAKAQVEIAKKARDLRREMEEVQTKYKNDPTKRLKKIKEIEEEFEKEKLFVERKSEKKISDMREAGALWEKRAGENPLKRMFAVNL